jgi:hypothetical protein
MAAPLKSGPTADAAQQLEQQADEMSTDWTAGAVPGTGKTMGLLLELQKRETGPPANPAETSDSRPASARPAVAGARPVPAVGFELGIAQTAARPGTEEPAPRPGGFADSGAAEPRVAPVLFGATQAPAIQATRPSTAEWRTAVGGSTGAPPRQYHSSSELQRWALMPAEFIAWLRQNRYAVVAGALVTLAVVWMTGALVNRRRYAP